VANLVTSGAAGRRQRIQAAIFEDLKDLATLRPRGDDDGPMELDPFMSG